MVQGRHAEQGRRCKFCILSECLEAELKRKVLVTNSTMKTTAVTKNLKAGWYTERAMKEVLKLSKPAPHYNIIALTA